MSPLAGTPVSFPAVYARGWRGAGTRGLAVHVSHDDHTPLPSVNFGVCRWRPFWLGARTSVVAVRHPRTAEEVGDGLKNDDADDEQYPPEATSCPFEDRLELSTLHLPYPHGLLADSTFARGHGTVKDQPSADRHGHASVQSGGAATLPQRGESHGCPRSAPNTASALSATNPQPREGENRTERGSNPPRSLRQSPIPATFGEPPRTRRHQRPGRGERQSGATSPPLGAASSSGAVPPNRAELSALRTTAE